MSIETQLPSTLDERQKNVVQMQTIERLTVEPGVMMLPCSQVSGAENSEQWAIELEHPIEGEHRFFREKPREGWHDDHELVKLLNWYHIDDNNPYKLQEKFLYVRKSEESEYNHGWELVSPDYDSTPSRKERLKAWFEAKRPTRDALSVFAIYTIAQYFIIGMIMHGYNLGPEATLAAVFGSVIAIILLGVLIPTDE